MGKKKWAKKKVKTVGKEIGVKKKVGVKKYIKKFKKKCG